MCPWVRIAGPSSSGSNNANKEYLHRKNTVLYRNGLCVKQMARQGDHPIRVLAGEVLRTGWRGVVYWRERCCVLAGRLGVNVKEMSKPETRDVYKD
jgi:hypothetical protein